MIPRVGQGFDIHPFSTDPNRPMVLGGVAFDGPGLQGHSDADVVCHAIADALLGAAGMGDIGSHFPDTDPAYEGIRSTELLARVVLSVSELFVIGNVDVTLILESPKIAPVRETMRTLLEDIVGAPVSIKGKRGEGLGAIGRSEGVACLSVALLVPR
jgi:2-C-methyl-D-erythritol 2,4-cyclodiphosphate synthase